MLTVGLLLICVGYFWNFAFGTLVREIPRFKKPGVSTVAFVWIGQGGLLICVIASAFVLVSHFSSVRAAKQHDNHAKAVQSPNVGR